MITLASGEGKQLYNSITHQLADGVMCPDDEAQNWTEVEVTDEIEQAVAAAEQAAAQAEQEAYEAAQAQAQAAEEAAEERLSGIEDGITDVQLALCDIYEQMLGAL